MAEQVSVNAPGAELTQPKVPGISPTARFGAKPETKKEELSPTQAYEEAKAWYKTKTGRSLEADLEALLKKRDGKWEVEDDKPVREAVGKMLGVPENAHVNPLCDEDSKSALLREDKSLLAGRLKLGDKTFEYRIDLANGAYSINDSRVSRSEIPGLLGLEPASCASAPAGLGAMFTAAERYTGKDCKWQAAEGNKLGEAFFKKLPQYQEEAGKLQGYLEAVAQKGGVDEVNKFLLKKGFTIQLREPTGEHKEQSIAAASVADVQVEWIERGKKGVMELEGQRGEWVPSVKIKSANGERAEYYTAEGHKHPIVELKTKDNTKFFITRFDAQLDPMDPFAANEAAAKLAAVRQKGPQYSDVEFPMADYNRDGRLTPLIGASTTCTKDGLPAVITQAEYQHRFRLNPDGARGQAAGAIGMERGIDFRENPCMINGPYLAWFEAPQAGGAIPFAALITRKDMKDPGSLK